MRTLLRVAFVALIALGLTGRALRAGHGEAPADPTAALRAGLTELGITSTEVPESRLLAAHSPLCDQPFLVGPLRIDGAEDEFRRQVARPGVVVRYLYLGRAEDHPSRLRMLARWGWGTLLFNVGLQRTQPPRDMALVAFPESCGRLATLDWAMLSPGG